MLSNNNALPLHHCHLKQHGPSVQYYIRERLVSGGGDKQHMWPITTSGIEETEHDTAEQQTQHESL